MQIYLKECVPDGWTILLIDFKKQTKQTKTNKQMDDPKARDKHKGF